MNVGFVGLGKLGHPVAYCMASRGLTVYGHDPLAWHPPADCSHEAGFAELIPQAEGRMLYRTLPEVVEACDVIFVAVQTPHEPRFEGVTPIPDDRADFDYAFLVDAVSFISREADLQGRDVTVAVISTVLPGTMARYVEPVLSDRVSLVYTPSFIAMGTTIRDFLHPEFVLLGGDDDQTVACVFAHIYGIDRPRHARVSIQDAELVKVAYNTFIGLKIAFANTLMEVCDKTGCDVDEVTGALKLAHRRLISPAYLDGGMGDGGGCHPRDNIALSWLARDLDLSFDLFNAAMECREKQAEWIAMRTLTEAIKRRMPVGILGVAYKPGSHLTTGSPALLVKHLIEKAGHKCFAYDPHADKSQRWGAKLGMPQPMVWLVGCKHEEFGHMIFDPGTVIIDPFRYIRDMPDVEVIRLGEGERAVPHHGATGDGREVSSWAA